MTNASYGSGQEKLPNLPGSLQTRLCGRAEVALCALGAWFERLYAGLMGRVWGACVAILLLAALPATADAAELRLRTAVRGLDRPTSLVGIPGHPRLFVVTQRDGRIVLVRRGKRSTLLDARHLVDSGDEAENGMFSVAFSPRYRRDRRFYVSYSGRDGRQTIDEWRTAKRANRVVPSSRRTVLAFPHPERHHYGGQLAFGRDRLLYASFGDGGEHQGTAAAGALAQRLDTLFGKIIRIDPRADGERPYRIPAGNPFLGTPGTLPEIWSYGLRNPWRFSFDARTGDLLLGDVGEAHREEINWLRATPQGAGRGANLGWNCFEGSLPFEHLTGQECRAPGHVRPVFEYDHYEQGKWPIVRPGVRVWSPSAARIRAAHQSNGCTGSVTGGYVVRDRQVRSLYGQYVFADFCSGNVYRAKRSASGAVSVWGLRRNPAYTVVAFGEDTCRRLYVLDIQGGAARRFEQGKSRCPRR